MSLFLSKFVCMKFLAQILIIIIVILNIIPCNISECHHLDNSYSTNTTISSSSSLRISVGDYCLCSPFCSCNCSHTFKNLSKDIVHTSIVIDLLDYVSQPFFLQNDTYYEELYRPPIV